MVNSVAEHSALHFLRNSSVFFCFARSWWDGNGLDTVAWWRDSHGCYHKAMRTGETCEPTTPMVISERSITELELTAIVSEFDALGICDLPSQEGRLILTHFDDWYGIRLPDMKEAHWLKIGGGLDRARRALVLLKHVFQHCPEIVPQDDI